MIKWKLDKDGKEYCNATQAAKFLGMPQTTFLYLLSTCLSL